jgi:spore germination cell wall hydrolase CwlJ-like protein
MKKIMQIIVSIIALTVMAPGHAIENTYTVDTVNSETIPSLTFTSKDEECLAKNIFFESANEPLEGKVAVGIVTINRSLDERFPRSICGVVNQRTVLERVKTVTTQVKTMFAVKEQTTQIRKQVAVCQFSWRCQGIKKPKLSDQRWEESQRIATELLSGGYVDLRIKYQDAIYFHAIHIKPSWAHQKTRVAKVGGHIFYSERT